MFERGEDYSHFLYLEDDIEVTPKNIEYWLEGRERLRPHRLYPSFLRYEITPDGRAMSTDLTKTRPINVYPSPRIRLDTRDILLGLRRPHQGLSLVDGEVIPIHGR